MPSKRARRTQGSPTHWAHIVLGVAHHSRVLLKTAKQDKKRDWRKKQDAFEVHHQLEKDDNCLLTVVAGSQNLEQEQIMKLKLCLHQHAEQVKHFSGCVL